MLFIIQALDRPAHHGLRTQVRADHLHFVARHVKAYRFGGPLLGDDGQPMGSLMILELPDRATLEAHLAADPFFSAGLFQLVQVWQTVQVVPEHEPGGLQREIERQRRQAIPVA